MKLNYQISGSGEPLIILHGLFGTLENWASHSGIFAEHFQVISVDLRNHGRSPHHKKMSYQDMADDIYQLMEDLGLQSTFILGHSMGGKVAMQLAFNHPSSIKKLIVADIAPVNYGAHHDEIFEGLFAIPLAQLSSRKAADDILKNYVADSAVRAFLLKNLYRDNNRKFAWRVNLDSLHQQYSQISKAPEGAPFLGDCLFIKGMNSNYILQEHSAAIKQLFPNTSFKMIEGTGHWLHAEKPKIFSQIVLNYLAR